jgi:hypothetical protein
VGLNYGPAPTEIEIEEGCTNSALWLREDTRYSWTEGGVAYDIAGADVDEESWADGCVDGMKRALRGEPRL